MVQEHGKQKTTHIRRFQNLGILLIYRGESSKTESNLLFAQSYTDINQKDNEVVFLCCRSLLFHEANHGLKKDGNADFDVAIGSYHRAEVYDLARLLMLNKLSKKNFLKITLGYIEMMDYLYLKIIN